MIIKMIHLISRVLPLIAVVLVVLVIIVSNELAGFGQKTLTIDSTLSALRQENSDLQEHIASASALAVVEEKARAAGFGTASQSITIGLPDVALRQPN